MISLRQEEAEPMLPTDTTNVVVDLADEKMAGGKSEYAIDASQMACLDTNRKNRKLEALKQLVVAMALMMMGASTLRLFQRYSKPHHRHHDHQQDGNSFGLNSVSTTGWRTSKHAGGRMPMPPFPFVHPPRPTECYALSSSSSSDENVHFNLTVSGFFHSVFMDFSLKEAKVDIESAPAPSPAPQSQGEEREDEEDKKKPTKHHRKGGPPPPPCHGKKVDVLVSVQPLEEQTTATKKENETYICALDLPFGQSGLGLFHGKPDIKSIGEPREPHNIQHKQHHHHEDMDAGHAPMKQQEPFEPVSIKLRFPAGPYTVTSQPPLPPHFGHRPPPPPHRPHHHHKHGKGPNKESLKKKLLRFWKSIQHKDQGEEQHRRKSTATIPASQDVKAAETILP